MAEAHSYVEKGYQIASYIGVKPESLSRIRKRIHDTR